MRIAFVINQFPPNITAGLGRYAEMIAPHLSSGHDLAVLTLNDGGLPVWERAGGVTAYRPRGRVLGWVLGAVARGRRLNRTRGAEFLLLALTVVVSNWRYFLLLRRLPPARRPDVVAVHDSTNFLCGLLSHYVLRLPVVFHVHTTEYGVARQRSITDPLGLFAALERWLARISRRVVVATPEVREQLLAAGWDRTPIDVVRLGGTYERVVADPGFDREKLRLGAADLRARLGIGAEDPVLLFVGRIERQKGVYELLEAMPAIAAAVPGLRLVIVGEGDEDGVRRIAAGSGLGDRVLTSGGFVDGQALLEHYAMADACVFPSLFEPFGLVATEAMALSRPVILGDGFSRIFLGDPAEPAVRFVRADEPGDIAEGVVEVMSDPDLRRALAERGERLVRETLSWRRAADETLAVYAGSAGKAGRR
ncbi:glycosyltransferase family 1 protein [Microbispora triticiradicis]|uniref:Glycosyltransferase family 4 protein n=3 Tax=Microbispora TaxID=2005 RepID=A0ABY3LS38_9ACTN|nr:MULTISPECIES: glycosyltransferase family 4 protein [Microbispora]RGA06577.1 glycosyltransferase family 1 protein [Microbispora triticiradicis]TLP66803.1 glycosyltransferase family 4 protein [Microbispora fusca]TYB50594.1 glycosyltransferase family 4 protein [Microbispora tritici]GLW25746.1 glycosyl transferase family 1 [Microbispora amethystogenes]